MSFETWIRKSYGRDADLMHQDIVRKVAWDAARTESEAEIATLQSERDALKERIRALEGAMNPQDVSGVDAALSIPASGEPARKP